MGKIKTIVRAKKQQNLIENMLASIITISKNEI